MYSKTNPQSTPFNFSDLFTHSTVSPETIDSYVKERIQYKCNRLSMSFHLSSQDREDLQQDFLMALVTAMAKYKPTQVSWKTYINSVLNFRYQHHMRHYNDIKQHAAMNPESIESIDVDTLCQDNFMFGSYTTSDLKIDLENLISDLPSNLQNICKHLLIMSPAETARTLKLSKSTISRAMDQIRVHFANAGFGSLCLEP